MGKRNQLWDAKSFSTDPEVQHMRKRVRSISLVDSLSSSSHNGSFSSRKCYIYFHKEGEKKLEKLFFYIFLIFFFSPPLLPYHLSPTYVLPHIVYKTHVLDGEAAWIIQDNVNDRTHS